MGFHVVEVNSKLRGNSFHFRRAFQLLSAGLFLPGSLGIIDPCEVTVIFNVSIFIDVLFI